MKADEKLDCFGLLCPMPIIKTTQKIKEMKPGEVLEIIATDEGIKPDIKAWALSTGNEVLKIEVEEGEPTVYHVFVRKK